jgi:hypothetical protein
MQRNKLIYVAAATPSEAAADLRRLGLLPLGDRLRVVVPARLAPQLESLVLFPRAILWRYRLFSAVWLWLRLIFFLGFSRDAEVVVYSPAGGARFLKLLALSLRGRVSFSDGRGNRVPFSIGKVLHTGLRRRLAARGPICLIGAAAPGMLHAILASLRARYPEAPVHGVLPAALAAEVHGCDSLEVIRHPDPAAYLRLLRRSIGRGRFRRIILPWTEEPFTALRWMAWLLPLGRVEIYNENLDAFSGRSIRRLLSHWFWRKRLREKQRRRTLPVGVVGSASSFYLEKILPVVRVQCPGVPVQALLPESLAGPASHLFDAVEVLRGNFLAQWRQARRFVARRNFQCWILPCTNEPYARMKFFALLLPLARRRIYNELADGFAARELGTLYGHCLWRLRDHLSFQIVTGAAGSNRPARAGHLVSYAVRLLAGAVLLARTLLRARFLPRPSRPTPRVDLFVLSAAEDSPAAVERVSSSASVRVVRVVRNGSLSEVNAAIQASNADFVCLLDGECRLSPSDWIERLLQSFDDRTAQVGPQLSSPDGGTLLRGLLLESRGSLAWNLDNAVQWRRRPECLEVDALPWPCVLIRRKIFSEVGYFAEDSSTMEGWADARFSDQLAARGWRSVCNRSVTATHPAAELRLRAALREVTEELQR